MWEGGGGVGGAGGGEAVAGRGSTDLIANNLAQACIKFISHPGSCTDSSHPSRLSHAYHASSFRETRAPIPCFVQKLGHLCSAPGTTLHVNAKHDGGLHVAGLHYM